MTVVAERERDLPSDVVPPSLDPYPPGVNGDTVRSSQQSYHPLQDPMHMPDSSPYLCSGSVDYFDCSLLRRNEATENGKVIRRRRKSCSFLTRSYTNINCIIFE